MSSHFSANQYEDAFNPKKLKNWTVPRKHKERPSTLEGFTQIIATDRGHLKADVPRSKESPWGTFMGTWVMPRNIPPAKPSYTARSYRAADNLRYFKGTSPLNNAVNGYKEFAPNKSAIKTSPIQRPKTPSPPASNRTPEKLMDPSAGVAKTPSPRNTPTRKSLSPRVTSNQGTPVCLKPATPTNIADRERTPSPLNAKPPSPTPSVKSDLLPGTPDSGRPRSRDSAGRIRSPAHVEAC